MPQYYNNNLKLTNFYLIFYQQSEGNLLIVKFVLFSFFLHRLQDSGKSDAINVQPVNIFEMYLCFKFLNMIQRVQTIYLFLAVILCILLFFMPLASITMPGATGHPEDKPVIYEMDIFSIVRMDNDGVTTIESTYWLVGINVIVLVFSLLVIFLYKNRQLQMRLVRFCFLLVLIFLILAFYYTREMQYATLINAPISYKIADVFPILQLLFFHLANKGINKDEELVKSADRIR